ncbi:hypothetical protein ABKV19_007967 [Rosa sericea]
MLSYCLSLVNGLRPLTGAIASAGASRPTAPRPCSEIRTPTGPTVLHRVYPPRLVRLRAPNAGDGGTKHNRHQIINAVMSGRNDLVIMAAD